MLVRKFGGSSVVNTEQLGKVRKIVQSHSGHQVVVVSAPKGMTDDLMEIARSRESGVPWEDLWVKNIMERFVQIVAGLGLALDVKAMLQSSFDQMFVGKVNSNFVASRGEAIHSQIVATMLGATHVEAADIFRFEAGGQLNQDWTYDLIRRSCSAPGLYVVGGFYGSAADGSIRTLGRGGSDETGAQLATALRAERYENWTDTDGILVADPRIVQPRGDGHSRLWTISGMTYGELWELAAAGAKVMFPGAVVPVAKAGIPLHVMNTNNPDHHGTLIKNDLPEVNGRPVTGMAGKRPFTTFVIERFGINSEFGFGAHVLQVFRRARVSYNHSPDGLNMISVVVQSDQLTAEKIAWIVQELQEAGGPGSKVQVLEQDMATITVVARGLDQKPEVAAMLFAALARVGVSPLTISKGRTGLGILVGVRNAEYEKAMQAVHDEFFS